jgi:signal transduction histidine kinase
MKHSTNGALDTPAADAGGELDAFAYRVAHDLRTPLRAVSGFAGLLADEHAADLPKPAQRYLEVIQLGVHELNEMLDSLLALARAGRTPLVRRPVDPAPAARAALAALGAVDGDPPTEALIHNLPGCYADPVALEQVFSILLASALEVTNGHGAAGVEVGYEAGRGPPGSAPCASYFVRPVGQIEGTVVEFAAVQRLIRRHGGEIWTSRPTGDEASVHFTIGDAP